MKLSDAQAREQSTWLNEIYRWGGFTSQAEWARLARYPEPNLSRAMSGKAGIEGINVIRLYKAAESQAVATERPLTVAADEEIRAFAVRLLGLASELSRRLGLEEADG